MYVCVFVYILHICMYIYVYIYIYFKLTGMLKTSILTINTAKIPCKAFYHGSLTFIEPNFTDNDY